MKKLLVPLAGSPTDTVVTAAATLLARKLGGHLSFLHVHLDPAEAAFNHPFARGARGGAVRTSIQHFREQAEQRCAAARAAFETFCTLKGLRLTGNAATGPDFTASWQEAEGASVACILAEARSADLVIMGRSSRPDGLPMDRLESVLLQSGRPLLLVPAGHIMESLDHAMIAWKREPEAEHAVTAALPVLALCRTLSVVHVGRQEPAFPQHLRDALGRSGCSTPGFRTVPKTGSDVFATLLQTAHEARADLVVMGGYGKSPWRELLFGGVTDTAVRKGDVPLFIMH